ncbi:MAG: redoxin domain-containing protein, partial [Alphaproteobacteria bacterium]|nr:redoxin domain-containing protein [Alphaproteobacteria bacterium]
MQRNLNLILMAVALLVTLGITVALQQPANTPRTVQTAPVDSAAYEQAGQPTPAAALTLLDGRTVALADYKGKVVVLNFWATWCVPCAVEYPQMIRLAQAMPDGLVIIAVSVDAEAPAIDRFIKRHGSPPANFIIAHDPEKKVSQE